MQSGESKKPTIGFLVPTTREIWKDWIDAFEQKLKERGWAKGDLAIDYQEAQGLEKNYAKHAKSFVDRRVDVIVTGGTQPTIACKKAAAARKPPIPVVFATAGDPIDTKLVPSFSAPGNLTGLSNQQTNLVIKRLDLLRLLVGKASVGLVGNDKALNVQLEMKIAQQVAPSLGLKVVRAPIRKKEDIAPVIRKLKGKVKGLLVCTDPLLTTHADELNHEAARAKLPTVHAFREYLDHGGCISFGPNFVDLFKRAAEFVDQILRGSHGKNMANIPVEQPNNLEGRINLPAFKAINFAVPEPLLSFKPHDAP